MLFFAALVVRLAEFDPSDSEDPGPDEQLASETVKAKAGAKQADGYFMRPKPQRRAEVSSCCRIPRTLSSFRYPEPVVETCCSFSSFTSAALLGLLTVCL